MDIEKANKLLEIIAKRDKVVKFRDNLKQKGHVISIDNSNNSSFITIKKETQKASDGRSGNDWIVVNPEIKDLESIVGINDAAEWFYDRVIDILDFQIKEYDKEILSL